MLPDGVVAKFEYYRVVDAQDYYPEKGAPRKSSLERYFRSDGFHYCKGFPPRARGGKTICYLYKDCGNEGPVGASAAVCSMSDNFCYRTGRDIALGRALKALEA